MIELTWKDVMNMILQVANLDGLLGSLKGHKVYGIPRGGILVATLLSYRGCELVTTPPKDPNKSSCTVIVDDIADTGETLKEWHEKGFATVALIVREGCKPLPTYFSQCISKKDYIRFPWEDPIKATEMETEGAFKDHV